MEILAEHKQEKPYFKLRWFFQYPDKHIGGIWDMSAKGFYAYEHLKPGLLYAGIEGKNCYTRDIHRFVVCEGSEFCQFQWMAVSRMTAQTDKSKAQLLKQESGLTPVPTVFGLSLLARNKTVEVYKNGLVNVKDENNDQKTMLHFARSLGV